MTFAERARESWANAPLRERTLLVIGTALVVGVGGYALAWEPLIRDMAVTERALATTLPSVPRAQLAANEIAGLRRDARAPRTPELRAAAERVVGAAGLRGALTSISAGEGRVRLTFAAIDFAALNALVDQLARDEQLFVAEALLAARVVPGSVRAEVSLARPVAR